MATSVGGSEVWSLIGQFQKIYQASGDIGRRRVVQTNAWMWSEVGEGLKAALRENGEVMRLLSEIETDVSEGRMAPTATAHLLLETFRGSQ